MGLFTAYHASERFGRVVVLERGRIGDPADGVVRSHALVSQRLSGPNLRPPRPRGLPPVGRVRAADRDAGARALRLPEHRQALGHPRPGRHLRAAAATRRWRASACARSPSIAAALRDALRLPRRRPRAPRRRRRRRRPARGHRRADAALAARGVRVARGRRDARRRARRRGAARAHRRRGARRPARSSSPPATAPTTSSRCCPDCGLQRPARQGPPERGEVLRPAGRRARALHGGRHAGDRLPRHRDLLPPDRRRARRGREDRLLQPARHAHEHARRSTASQSFVEQCVPGLRDADGQRRRGRRPVRLRPRRRRRLRAGRRSRACANAFVGVGWRGTGYKFAPWVGRVLAELARPGRAPSTTSPASTRADSRAREAPMARPSPRTLQQRLSDGVVLGAEGYVFELERRGYVQAGPFVPEVILDEPDALRQLHRELPARRVRRDGRADLLRAPRQAARRRARRRPRGDEPPGGAGSPTRSPPRAGRSWPATSATPGPTTRASPRRRAPWSARSTRSSSAGRRRRASTSSSPRPTTTSARRSSACRCARSSACRPWSPSRASSESTTYDGYDYVEACRILADHGATVVGLNCSRGPETMLPLLEAHPRRGRRRRGGAAGPVPDLAGGPGLRGAGRGRRPARLPDRARALPVHALRDGGLRACAPATSASTTSASAAAPGPHHVRAMAEALGRTTPASRYSPAIDLHPVLGDADEPHGAHGRLGRRGRLARSHRR